MSNKIIAFIQSPIYLRVHWNPTKSQARKHQLVHEAIMIFIKKMSNNEILDRTNGVAYSFTLAIFPGIIFLFTLTPYIQNLFPEITNDDIIHFLENYCQKTSI